MKRRKQKKSRLRVSLNIMILFFIIMMAEALFYTWCRVQCREAGYKIAEAKKEHNHLIAVQKRLRVELAGLKSPERIAGIAKTEFGLVMPGPGQTIIIP